MASTAGSWLECSDSKHFKSKKAECINRSQHSSPARWEAIPRVHGIISQLLIEDVPMEQSFWNVQLEMAEAQHF